jgi:Protein of unknown function (DUF3016)
VKASSAWADSFKEPSMNGPLSILATLASAAMLATTPPVLAAGTVEVRYIEPQKFTDVGFGTVDRERTLSDMTAVLQAFAAKLPDGQTLTFEVTDINLAGEWRPHRGNYVRVLSGTTDWPEIKLRYTLQAGGTTLKSGEARVYDIAYQLNSNFVDKVGTNLPYERHMLRKWFNETFAPAP